MTDEKKPAEDEATDEQLENVAGGKIGVGETNDTFEREADGVADEVSGDKKPPGRIYYPCP
jgi:hypothetical protein